MLTASPVTGISIERQKKILALIRENPLGSYVFSGAPGVGKTTMLRELEQCSRAALWKNHGIFSSGMREFQRNLTAQSRGEAVSGLITAASLRRGPSISMRWSVFLDDFDKVTGTEFVRLELLDFIDAAVTSVPDEQCHSYGAKQNQNDGRSSRVSRDSCAAAEGSVIPGLHFRLLRRCGDRQQASALRRFFNALQPCN